jgi:hypothetical protein
MRLDIVGSIIITLILMLVCNIFRLGLFGSIFLLLGAFLVFNYRRRFRGYLYNAKSMFMRKPKKVELKSSFDGMKLED